MNLPLRKAWESRAPRERTIIAVVVVLFVAIAYVWLVHSATQARGRLHASVAALQAQSVQLAQQAAEYASLRAAPAATNSPTDLHTLVQTGIGDAGLLRSLVRIDAQDANQVVVVFGAVPFADWLKWIGELGSQHIRLDACRIEALATPGLVSITATLARSQTP